MNLRKALFEPGAEIEEILKGEVRMQSADDVQLGDRLVVSRGCGFKGLVERHSVGAGSVFFAAEGAKAAGGDTNIGRIDVAIDIEISPVAMHAFANMVGHPAES